MAVTTIGSAAGSGLQQYEQIFTTSGTWTKPMGVKTAEVICVGGGASGGFSYSSGGGGAVFRGIVDVSAVSTVAVTIGAGGTVNTTTNGGDSSFGSLVVAGGGRAPSAQANGGASGQWYQPAVAGNVVIYPSSQTGTASGTTANEITNDGSGALKFNGSYYLMINSAGGTVKKSTDGITWSSVASISNAGTTYNTKLEWGNGLWVLVGGQSTYLTSPDGVTWTSRTLPGSNTSAMAISYANGKWWLAGGTALTLYWSTDGISWTSVTPSFNGFSATAGRVAYGNGVYVCVPTSSSSGYVSYSADGTTWSAAGGLVNFAANSNVVFSGSSFVAGSSGNSTLFVSTNGSSWTNYTSVSGTGIGDMFVTAAGIIFLTSSSATNTYYSADGGRSTVQLQASSYMRGVAGATNSVTFYAHQSASFPYFRGGTYYGSTATPPYSPGGTTNAIGGSAGGQHVIYSNGNNYPGPRLEGYGQGGNSTYNPLNPGDGCFQSSSTSAQNGIVKVRWWA